MFRRRANILATARPRLDEGLDEAIAALRDLPCWARSDRGDRDPAITIDGRLHRLVREIAHRDAIALSNMQHGARSLPCWQRSIRTTGLTIRRHGHVVRH